LDSAKPEKKALGTGRFSSKGFCEEDPLEDARGFIFLYISETNCVNPDL
jgi:hypothetical protein